MVKQYSSGWPLTAQTGEEVPNHRTLSMSFGDSVLRFYIVFPSGSREQQSSASTQTQMNISPASLGPNEVF